MRPLPKFFAVLLVLSVLLAITSCEKVMPVFLPADDTRRVVILEYHDFTSSDTAREYTVTAAEFESQLSYLSRSGYETVFFADLIEFVYGEGELPEKCVVITSDDGYRGVIEIASPICQKYGMKMSCAVIGNKTDMPTHFDPSEADTDTVEITSHSYALHDNGVAELDEDAIRGDAEMMAQSYGVKFPTVCTAFTYPHGFLSDESEKILADCGYLCTVTTDYGVNYITRGDSDSLRRLRRIQVYKNTTGEKLVRTLDNAE